MNSENWPDYNLLGGQGDFERIENALLLLVGHGQLCNSDLVVHFVMQQGETAQRGQGIGDSDGVAVSVGGAKDCGQPALDFALEFQSKHGAEDMSAGRDSLRTNTGRISSNPVFIVRKSRSTFCSAM